VALCHPIGKLAFRRPAPGRLALRRPGVDLAKSAHISQAHALFPSGGSRRRGWQFVLELCGELRKGQRDANGDRRLACPNKRAILAMRRAVLSPLLLPIGKPAQRRLSPAQNSDVHGIRLPPHALHRSRWPAWGTAIVSGSASTITSALCPQVSHSAVTARTPFCRMFASVMGGPGRARSRDIGQR
jgi:hypothetical protein